jgi:hypothetical protein
MADGRFVIAVDAGSNQLSMLRIHPGGSLSLVPGVVSSGGTLPVSIAVQHRLPSRFHLACELERAVTASAYPLS